jgi:CBS-domain-containing membrane protein
MTVEDVMTRDVITVSTATPIHEAARLMVEHGVSGLPVIDADGRLAGIISDGDLILRQRRRKETPWWHSFFTNGEQIVREYQRAVGTTVGEVMSRPAVTISPVWGSRLPLRFWTAEISVDCPRCSTGDSSES